MATRRRIGRGLQAAGDVLGDYFAQKQRSDAAAQAAEADDERARKQAIDIANMQHGKALDLEFLKQNPTSLAERLGRPRPNRDVASPIAEGIGKADSLEKALTNEDVTNQYRTGGGRETLDSRNFRRAGPVLSSDPNPGGASVLADLQGQANSKRDMLTREAEMPDTSVEVANEDGSKSTKFVSKRKGGEYTTSLTAKQQGINEGVKEVAAAPGKIEATNAINKGTFDEKFRQEQKVAAMKAALEVENWKKINALKAGPVALKAATAATAGILQMEEIIALAVEVNKGNQMGVSDIYSGAKNAISQVPYVGPAVGGLMDTANATAAAFKDWDPSLIAKTNQLQSLRRAAAISVIRAAGDPRPSNADVDGVINSIPGAGESAYATALKSQTMRDTLTMVPEILKAHPELVGRDDAETGNGLRVIQLAQAEAAKRADKRAKSGRNEIPPEAPPEAPTAPASLETARTKLAARGKKQ